MPEPQINRYNTGQALARSLSRRIGEALAAAIQKDGEAFIAVSGGSTPKLLFQTLSKEDIDWAKVTVTLVDERFVPPSHERSNHRLVATHLLQNAAAFAKFIPLFSDHASPQEAAQSASLKIDAVGKPLDIAILGMGADGHTASWFPRSAQLTDVTDPQQSASVLAAYGDGLPDARLTLTLPSLRNAGIAVLHIEGIEKFDILEQALGDGPIAELPVRALLRRAERPVQIYWAP